MPPTLGERIRDARREAGFRNAESFAVKLGVGVRTVQRWESDAHDPTLDRLIQIARLTNQSLSFFVSENGRAA